VGVGVTGRVPIPTTDIYCGILFIYVLCDFGFGLKIKRLKVKEQIHFEIIPDKSV
jgi:hypothetical protein